MRHLPGQNQKKADLEAHRRKGSPSFFWSLTFSYSKHLGATDRADTFRCWSAIFHCYSLGVLHFSLFSTFHTIGLHPFIPFPVCTVKLLLLQKQMNCDEGPGLDISHRQEKLNPQHHGSVVIALTQSVLCLYEKNGSSQGRRTDLTPTPITFDSDYQRSRPPPPPP